MDRKVVFTIICLLAFSLMAGAQEIDVKRTEELSPFIFGHNLEHTRAAVNGGLSAQMLSNRKFAGRPSRNEGVASKWFGIGEKVLFQAGGPAYTRHIGVERMRRSNELISQSVQNLKDGQTAGIGQGGLTLTKGREYEMRAVTRVSVPVELKVELTDRSGSKAYAMRSISLKPSEDWVTTSFKMVPSSDDADACVRYTFSEMAEVTFGALSMMPSDNFHGMRKDVVANLKAIGPRIIRWPGGNFAGEYRWQDGLLPSDQRGPLQAATEIETQPYGDGYDFHEINTDDFIALCREVGAEPMITINLAWSDPEESAGWVEYCNGPADSEYGRKRAENGHPEPYNVRFWSLGNEMGYGHMEGPSGPKGYAALAEAHADAMLKVTPDLELCSSGPYPDDNWAENSAAFLADKVKYISLHHYASPSGGRHYASPEAVKATYEGTVDSFKGNISLAEKMRKSLDATGKKMRISFDEWNQWYAWYRPSCVAEGIYTARVTHFFINRSNDLDMPIVCYFQPIGEGAILIDPVSSRLTANGQVFEMMKAHQDGGLCHVEGNDDYSTAATLKNGVLTITMINASYDEDRDFSFSLKGKQLLDAVLYSSEDVTPHSYFDKEPLDVKMTRKTISTTLPPHSVAILRVEIKN